MILTLSLSSLLLEGDSLSVIRAIGSKEPNISSQENLISEIHSLVSQFAVYDVIHIGRQGNEAAHLLARHTRFVDDTIQWWHQCPDFFFFFILESCLILICNCMVLTLLLVLLI